MMIVWCWLAVGLIARIGAENRAENRAESRAGGDVEVVPPEAIEALKRALAQAAGMYQHPPVSLPLDVQRQVMPDED
jgi:hypothetical protein